ncbi:MAG: hypothetical protein IKN59_07520 [Paludibacteraceae bacterium]|nr:hypothetical protein [Paludibacteraceae bacterium]
MKKSIYILILYLGLFAGKAFAQGQSETITVTESVEVEKSKPRAYPKVRTKYPKTRIKDEYIPETMYFVMRGYEKSHWQKADSIDQIIDYLSYTLAENADIYSKRDYKERKQLLNYLTRHKKRYRYLLVRDVAIFLSRDYGYAVEDDVLNPCLFEEEYDQQSEMQAHEYFRAWRNAAKLMYDSVGHFIDYDVDSLDTIFHQMSMDLDKAFPAGEYIYVWHACVYDCKTGELQNYCTGEEFPTETAKVVKPYLEQLRAMYPNMVSMKFCRKLPVKRELILSYTRVVRDNRSTTIKKGA